MWAVCETVENGKRVIAVAPEGWIVGNSLFWPKKMSKNNILRAVINNFDKDDDWPNYATKILHKNLGKFLNYLTNTFLKLLLI